MNENLLNKQIEKYEGDVLDYKKDTRFVWDKIIVTSGVIIGFSISMSTSFKTMLNINLLKISWVIFLINILIGFFLLIMNSRINLRNSTESLMFNYDYQNLINTYNVNTDDFKNRFAALLLSQRYNESIVSEYGKNIIEQYGKDLGSNKFLYKLNRFEKFIYKRFNYFEIMRL